jgi:hypothetical protein
MKKYTLPALAPCRDINRKLSAPEYYHACVGSSRHTLEIPREVVFILEGQGRLPPVRWQLALDAVVAANPGCRLHMVGSRLQARWHSDGAPTSLRLLPDQHWDGRSQAGTEFIYAVPLSLDTGSTSELIVEEAAGFTRLIFRALHAVMDGMGAMHFYQELFRALRGEALLGCNAAFSDTDIMHQVAGKSASPHGRPGPITQPNAQGATGDGWLRLSLQTPQPALLARTALALAAFARQSDTQTVVIAIPVDLRRHVPGLHTTSNAASMVHVEVSADDDADAFRRKLRSLLQQQAEAPHLPILDWIRLLPLPWFDRLVSRNPGNFRRRKVLETAVISNLGAFAPRTLACPGFAPQSLYGVPIPGNAFVFLFGLGDRIELTVGLPNVLGDGGRAEALMEHLERELRAPVG